MNVSLQSLNASENTSELHHPEDHPPSFGPESLITTLTGPPLTKRSDLCKAALLQTRKELADKETTFEHLSKGLEEKIHEIDALAEISHKVLLQRVAKMEKSCDERLKLLEEKIHEIDAVKASQKVLMRGEVDHHIHI